MVVPPCTLHSGGTENLSKVPSNEATAIQMGAVHTTLWQQPHPFPALHPKTSRALDGPVPCLVSSTGLCPQSAGIGRHRDVLAGFLSAEMKGCSPAGCGGQRQPCCCRGCLGPALCLLSSLDSSCTSTKPQTTHASYIPYTVLHRVHATMPFLPHTVLYGRPAS